jgi:hypothetical protein
MEIKDLKKNSSAISAGQWVDDIPDMGELRLKVRGLSSPAVSALRARKERAVPRKQRNRDGTLKQATAMRISSEILAEIVLIDWEGITDGGKPVPYDKALATKWLTDLDYQDFANAGAWAAMLVDRGESDELEELAGN